MFPDPAAPRRRARLMVWWIIWAGVLGGLVMIYVFLGRTPQPRRSPQESLTGLVGLGPLFLSVVTRWLVLPRFRTADRALPVFIVGLAMAEGCGILGIFLGGPYRDDLFLLGVLGILQFVPLFAGKLDAPASSGFIPNH
jgi:hypothetical protein